MHMLATIFPRTLTHSSLIVLSLRSCDYKAKLSWSIPIVISISHAINLFAHAVLTLILLITDTAIFRILISAWQMVSSSKVMSP